MLKRGQAAEDFAAQYLQKQGLKLLLRNFHCRRGEIDLLMQDQQDIVVIEVRARAAHALVDAAQTVDLSKQARLIAASQYCMAQHPEWAELAWRFDVFCLDGKTSRWIRDAFQAL